MERLQKVLAHAGVASRRKSEELISKGHVRVNGTVVKEMGVLVGNSDLIEVDGVPIYREEPVYFLLNKPRNMITAVSDDKDRPVVTDLFPNIEQRIYPVGRLDYDTTGALILTNDGELSQLLMHPKHQIDKTYVAKVKGMIDRKSLNRLEKGVVVEGKKTAPAKAKILSADRSRDISMVELTIHEGRNRQVKNMFQAIGHPVEKLKRESYGTLTLDGLQPGEWRELKTFEIYQLRNAATQNDTTN
ncbi:MULTISPECIES: pseudouridine synthase [Carnobacterium]|uniref:Pseudouridine synthase n=2 Tax=Carnobacterium inhibens TaxID=147709 RepID=U5S8L1_9LACT|nr:MULTISPECIES: pseudouridine synthase [Carnobacterium]AGY81575.1 ribosomal large subunit pseudouridine synthase B [Carnobacterium inhibens subsp. gilichinskyi]MBC9824725.1 pseudouridine synthase [Carnobacterium inhibens]MCM3512672.1 rRNA pseudouridine synthase [Carnobacterium inhibens]MDN5371499.1 rRNA synthase [Carnobacterium sp.]